MPETKQANVFHGRLNRGPGGRAISVTVYAWGASGETAPVLKYLAGDGAAEVAINEAGEGDAVVITPLGAAIVSKQERKG